MVNPSNDTALKQLDIEVVFSTNPYVLVWEQDSICAFRFGVDYNFVCNIAAHFYFIFYLIFENRQKKYEHIYWKYDIPIHY